MSAADWMFVVIWLSGQIVMTVPAFRRKDPVLSVFYQFLLVIFVAGMAVYVGLIGGAAWSLVAVSAIIWIVPLWIRGWAVASRVAQNTSQPVGQDTAAAPELDVRPHLAQDNPRD